MSIVDLLLANWKILILPILGLLIGWGTNWLALKMLFRPRESVGIGNYRVQGLIPSRRNDISGSIAKIITDELLSTEDLVKAMEDLDIKRIALSQVETIVKNKVESLNLKKTPPLNLLEDSIIQRAQSMVSNQVEDAIDDFLSNMSEHVSVNLDINHLIEQKLGSLDDSRIEEIITDISKKELRHIESLWAILGFIIGCVQVILIWILD